MAIKVQGITVIDDGRNIINGIGASFTGIVTATTFSGSGANLTSIPNSGLANSSITIGGVTLNLGDTDATPAFDLSDATDYPFTSLTGITTEIVGDTTPQLGGNLDLNSKFITGTGGINVSGVVTATTFSGSGANLTSIPNSGLANSSITIGGVTLNLGDTDATPAFNLSDATAYPYTSLTGITTSIVGDTTPQLGGNLDLNSKFITGTGGVNVTGVVTATTFSGSGANLTSVPNGALDNSTVSYGGVELSLGGSDATPAFDLSDATDYPYTSLTGITTEIVGDTTPQLGGNLDLNSKFITGTGGINVSGVVTATSFVGNVTGNADTATSLATARTFELTGDVVASQISFDGTGNVSLAATIQPNSVALGGDTTGDYVESISGTGNQITVSSGTGEGSTPVISIPNNPTLPGTTVTVETDLQVNRNLNVTGNVTIGGTSATLFTETLKISDPDIIVGFRTDAAGNDISNDTTANHGGIAVASTEGSPLVSLSNGGEPLPETYKKIMWFESGAFTGLATDAWLTNYAFGVGTTSMSAGTKFAVGDIETDFDDITSVRHINSSGVVTATTFSGSGASLTSIPNGALTNSSIAIGGVTLNLGDTDATPAFNLSDATDYPTSSLVGTITNDQLAGSIANAKLANSSIAIGGVTLNLGDTDATPAFDLSDATDYPYTSLTGITTEIVGDTTPQLGGNLDLNSKFITGTGGINVSGIITATTFSGSGANLTSIPNGALTNSSIAIGGVTLNLGDTDATPAFDLSDATDYPFTSLTGITTSIVGDTTPQLGGNLDLNSKFITGTGGINVSGVITSTTFSGSGASLTSIPNSALVNASVSFGGVSVDLGASDATPAFNLSDATNYPTSSLTGTITNDQLAGSIANAKLANSSIAIGGVTLNLGDTDATPAFNLSDATNYPTSSLTGTITNDQLAGSIADGKLASTFLKNVVEDTTPQLGGNLDLNSKFITGTGGINVSGVVTATSFVGSAANLTGLTGASAATYGDASNVAQIVVDADGRITGISEVTISGGGGGGGINGITVREEGSVVGTSNSVRDINIVGDNLTATASGVGATITFTSTPTFTSAAVGSGVTINADGINVTGIITATTFSGSGASLTSIPNGALTNSSITIGGVTLNLGDTDATPAFNLSDATAYPYTSLTGITTEIVGDTTPQLGGNLDLNSKFITGTGGINVTGVVTATSFTGSGANLTNLTGASAATYGDASNVAQIVVDANGRITGISEVTISGGGGGSGPDPVIMGMIF